MRLRIEKHWNSLKLVAVTWHHVEKFKGDEYFDKELHKDLHSNPLLTRCLPYWSNALLIKQHDCGTERIWLQNIWEVHHGPPFSCHSTVASFSSSSPSSALLILIIFEQIVIGAIIENTPAERDGRLRPGDELISVDKNVVAGKPHKYVIDLMHAAARNGQVSLTVRRRVQMPGEDKFSHFFFVFTKNR